MGGTVNSEFGDLEIWRFGDLADLEIWQIWRFGRFGDLADLEIWQIWRFGRFGDLADLEISAAKQVWVSNLHVTRSPYLQFQRGEISNFSGANYSSTCAGADL